MHLLKNRLLFAIEYYKRSFSILVFFRKKKKRIKKKKDSKDKKLKKIIEKEIMEKPRNSIYIERIYFAEN